MLRHLGVWSLLNTDKVVLNRPAVETGIAVLEDGGDFADGIMAHEGEWLGSETFVSFDIASLTLSRVGHAHDDLDGAR